MSRIKKLSLSSQGLSYKLRISFYLMSILPLLTCFYLVSNFILPNFGIRLDILVSLIVVVFIVALGYGFVKEVFKRILTVSNDAKLIAAGDINVKIQAGSQDEIGDLGSALNNLTGRIRSSMDELKIYSDKTNQINTEIQKRVLVLSSLLEISSLISQGDKIDEVLEVIVEKSRQVADSDDAFLLYKQEGQDTFYMRIVDGIHSQDLSNVKIEYYEEILGTLINADKKFIADRENVLPQDINPVFQEKFKLVNALILPVYLKGKVIALLGVGNKKDSFLYKKDDIELLDIFVKQIAIAVENNILIHRVEKLEIKDSLTGLYNAAFIKKRLQEEIRRAVTYQRPCSFIIMHIDNFQQFHQSFGALETEMALKKITALIRSCVSEIQSVARFGDDKFAIVLPENNKRQALQIAENIRTKIEFGFKEEENNNKRLTVSASISENPLDGTDADQLISKAQSLLNANKTSRNIIVGV